MTSEIRHEKSSTGDLLSRLSQFASTHGLELLGVSPLRSDEMGWFVPHAERFRNWIDGQNHADMEWLSTRLEERCMPHQLMPTAKSALVFWSSHHFEPFEKPMYRTANVARYAWGRDYHNILKKALRKVHRWLDDEFGTLARYTSVDTGAVLERAFAENAGLGWIGRSTMLIHQRKGTFGSLAVVFIDKEINAPSGKHPFRCGTCTACISDCPTGALSDQGLDSRLCISYWTIEHRGMIPVSFRSQIGNWLFGCDICQDVCPWNAKATYASPDRWRPKREHAWPHLIEWLTLSDSALDQYLNGSPLRRAKPEGLKRNICIVLANQNAVETVPILEEVALTHESPIVRATAVWACGQLGSARIIGCTVNDPSIEVQTERQRLLQHS